MFLMRKQIILLKIVTIFIALSISGCLDGNKAPISDFSYNTTAIGTKFNDNSTDENGKIEKWHWDFGDGNTSNKKDPIHLYLHSGDYNVTLTVTDNNDLIDSITKKVIVLVYAPLAPIANFTYFPINYITNETVITFNASMSETYSRNVTYHWDFGDKMVLNVTNKTTTHKYASAGVYIVNLTITDELGLFDYISYDIKVS